MIDPHEMIIDYFDEVYPHETFKNETKDITNHLLQNFGASLKGNKINVLDLCTGTGRALALFHGDTRFDIVGVDISEKMLIKARRNYPSIQFINDDVRYLNHDALIKKKIHCFMMSSVSIQLFNKEDRQKIFKKAEEILVDGGSFFFDIFTENSPDPNDFKNNAFIRYESKIGNKEVLIIYHRIPLPSHEPSKQYVHLLKKDGENPVKISTALAQYFNISFDDICNELKGMNLTPNVFKTEKGHTTFIQATKGGN